MLLRIRCKGQYATKCEGSSWKPRHSFHVRCTSCLRYLRLGSRSRTILAKKSATAVHRALRSEGERQPLAVGLGHHQSVLFSRVWLYREGHRGRSVKLYWMRTTEAWPEYDWLESQLTCFDEEKPDRASDSRWDTCIGNVQRVEGGRGGGMWDWIVMARFPGSRFPGPTSGREISRKDAGRCVVECYERILTYYNRYHPDG